jgi:hypothetical protein
MSLQMFGTRTQELLGCRSDSFVVVIGTEGLEVDRPGAVD